MTENAQTSLEVVLSDNEAVRPSLMSRVLQHLWRRSVAVPIALLMLVSVVLVPPVNEFPLNDSWLFASMVYKLLEDHVYVQHPFVQPTSVVHVAWGALVAAVLGPSYSTLQVATLLMGFLGAWATALCARVCGLRRWPAILCGYLVLAHPIYLSLANVYMTDVPFTAMLTLSAFFYLRAMRKGGSADIFWGSVFGVLAFFVRQFGILTAAAFVVTYCLPWLAKGAFPRPKREEWLAFLLPWAAAGVAYVGWKATHRLEGIWPPPVHASLLLHAHMLIVYVVEVATTAGLFLFPLTAVRLVRRWRKREEWSKRRLRTVSIFVIIGVLTFIMALRSPMPQPGNVLHRYGVGPEMLAGKFTEHRGTILLVVRLWWLATLVGLYSAGVLLSDLGRLAWYAFQKGVSVDRARALLPFGGRQAVFLLMWALFAFVSTYTPFTKTVFDRYLLPLIVPLTIVAVGAFARRGKAGWVGAFVMTTLIYAFSIAGLQDYMARNQARWALLDHLVGTMKVPPDQIDGGFEFNGIYNSKYFVSEDYVDFWSGITPDGCWMLDTHYWVTKQEMPGFKIVAKQSYYSWLSGSTREVLAVKRIKPRVGPPPAEIPENFRAVSSDLMPEAPSPLTTPK